MRVLLLLVVGGCALGGGTTTVGIWKPKHVVDTSVEIAEPDRAPRTVEVARDYPERSFGGALVTMFNPGVLHVGGMPNATNLMAFSNNLEYLRGRGGFALGLRVGGDFNIGLHDLVLDVPVNLLAHAGDDNWSLYGGPGFTWMEHEHSVGSMVATTDTYTGFNVTAGGRVLLRESRAYRLSANVDVTRHWLSDGVSATSATAGLGAHF